VVAEQIRPWIDLTGRVAVVTGAAAGIGRATALALAGAGAVVVALDLDVAGAEAVAGEIGGNAQARALDVTSQAEWHDVAVWIDTAFGRIDILVNSAGVALKDSVGDADLATYHRTFAINVEGTLLGMQTALRFMRQSGTGAIVNLSSSASLRGNSLMAAYGASKAAVAHYTRSAAVEVLRAGHDIRINAVHPGLIETAMADDLYKIYERIGPPQAVRAAVTTGRAGRPDEVADLIVYLVSDRASYVSGTSVVIDRAANA
jgi:NAD(P)-dependent dehydrogenase (short-subunit alcohol dehydrogenase family)